MGLDGELMYVDVGHVERRTLGRQGTGEDALNPVAVGELLQDRNGPQPSEYPTDPEGAPMVCGSPLS
jgi:hypothetical protein